MTPWYEKARRVIAWFSATATLIENGELIKLYI